MKDALARRLAAELVGTAILVLFGAGSVVAALKLGEGKLDYLIGPLAGGVLAAAAYDAIARPRAVEVEPAQGAQGDIEGRRDRAVEPAAEPGHQGTSGDIPGRRL